MRNVQLIGGAFVALAGAGLLYFRHVTLYSYRVDNPNEVHYRKSPTGFGIAGLLCITVGFVLIVRGW